MAQAYDAETISFYDREADNYAAFSKASRKLGAFIARLAPGAKVLELGCGAGLDAAAMLAAGLDVTATDASRELAALAAQRIGRPVRVMRFDELEETQAFDGVWANACLLHAPLGSLPEILSRIHTALRDGGIFYASFKGGDGEGRDRFGRYYSFPGRETLEACYARAARWGALEIEEGAGGGYDGVERPWFSCMAAK